MHHLMKGLFWLIVDVLFISISASQAEGSNTDQC